MKVSSDLRKVFSDHRLLYPRSIQLFLEHLQGHQNQRLLRQQHREHIHRLHRRLLYPMRLLEILLCQILLHLLQAVKDRLQPIVEIILETNDRIL